MKTFLKYLLLVLILILFWWFWRTCGATKSEDVSKIKGDVIVAFKSTVTEFQKDSAFNEFKKLFDSPLSVTRSKCPCDTLELWHSDEYFELQAPASVRPDAKPAGSFERVAVLKNNYEFEQIISPQINENDFMIKGNKESYTDIKDSKNSANQSAIIESANISNMVQRLNTNSQTIKIGIMDSGLDNQSGLFNNNIVKSTSNNCPNGSFNFVDKNIDINDEHIGKHGTYVSLLLLKNLQNKKPELYVQKVINKDQKGSLFNILCAIQHSVKNKLTAVNMSLGYYGAPDELFKKYMKALKDEGIWVFAAAGNQNYEKDLEEEFGFMQWFHKHILKNPSYIRNLDNRKNKFYPAAWSKEFDNIITVTTVQNNSGSVYEFVPDQNYSPNFVFIGQKADTIINGKYGFNITEQFLVGSSYATPIVAGKTLSLPISGKTRANLVDDVARASTSPKNQIVNNKYAD